MATPRQTIDPRRYLDIDGVRIDSRRLDAALARVPEHLKTELMDALDHIRRGFFKALYVNTGLKDRRFIAVKNVGIGRQIKVYRNPRKQNILDMELGIFTRSKIASMLERGGTVSAKSGAMTVPLPPALTATGRLKPELSIFKGYRRAYDPAEIKGFFLLKRNGRMLLVKKVPGTDEIQPYFIMKRQVRIQPRLRMMETWERMEGYRINVLNKSVEKALNKE